MEQRRRTAENAQKATVQMACGLATTSDASNKSVMLSFSVLSTDMVLRFLGTRESVTSVWRGERRKKDMWPGKVWSI
jgi:hypothetical protein